MLTKDKIAENSEPRVKFDFARYNEEPIGLVDLEHRPTYFLDTLTMRRLWDYGECPRPIVNIGLPGRVNANGFVEMFRLTKRDYRLYDGESIYKWHESPWYKHPCPKYETWNERVQAEQALLESHISYAPEEEYARIALAKPFGDHRALCAAYKEGYLWHDYLSVSFESEVDKGSKHIRFKRKLKERKDSRITLAQVDIGDDVDQLYDAGMLLLEEWEARKQRIHELDIQVDIENILSRIPSRCKKVCENILKTINYTPDYNLRFYNGKLKYRESPLQSWQTLYDTDEEG